MQHGLWILAQALVLVFKIGQFLHHYIINVCLQIFRWIISTVNSSILTFIYIPVLFLKNIGNIINIRKYRCSSMVCRYWHIAEKPHRKSQRRIFPDCGLPVFIPILQIIWCSNWNYAKIMHRIYTYKLSSNSNVFSNHVKIKV